MCLEILFIYQLLWHSKLCILYCQVFASYVPLCANNAPFHRVFFHISKWEMCLIFWLQTSRTIFLYPFTYFRIIGKPVVDLVFHTSHFAVILGDTFFIFLSSHFHCSILSDQFHLYRRLKVLLVCEYFYYF